MTNYIIFNNMTSWFGLPPWVEGAKSTAVLGRTISSSYVATPLDKGAWATDIRNSGALVGRPLVWFLSLVLNQR